MLDDLYCLIVLESDEEYCLQVFWQGLSVLLPSTLFHLMQLVLPALLHAFEIIILPLPVYFLESETGVFFELEHPLSQQLPFLQDIVIQSF